MAAKYGYLPRPGVVFETVRQTGSGSITQAAGSTPYAAGDYIITANGVQYVMDQTLMSRIFDLSNNLILKGD
jgi:hypothetical protein